MSPTTTSRRGVRWRPRLTSTQLALLVAIAMVLFYNGSFWRRVFEVRGAIDLHDVAFLAALFVLLVALLHLPLSVVATKHLQKPLTVLLMVSAAVAAYFMNTYGGVIDSTMMQNFFETDTAEAVDLLSGGLVGYVLALSLPVAVVVLWTRIRYHGWRRELRSSAIAATSSLLVIGVLGIAFYADLASLFNNHHELRHRITPVNLIVGTLKYFQTSLRVPSAPPRPIGEDATLGELAATEPKTLVIMVLGETARADEFSLNGYRRDTNPRLSREGIINFDNVTSCGTTSAISVRCMFSRLARADYSRNQASRQEGLLDVLQRAGLNVLWVENNSGCKGVCSRVTYRATPWPEGAGLCPGGECFDESLLVGLDGYLKETKDSVFIVLHQQGSHGPAYYRRYPPEFERFTPACRTSELQDCEVAEVVNSYDNTILYTDYFLSRVIGFLEERRPDYTTAMLYVSDHGESLGENGLYLHGLPFRMAPDQQKHVPLIVWLSDEFEERFRLSRQCLDERSSQSLSHDNIFDSVLGLMDVDTRIYDQELDLFAPCRGGPVLTASRDTPRPDA